MKINIQKVIQNHVTFYQALTSKECATLYVSGQHNSVDFQSSKW